MERLYNDYLAVKIEHRDRFDEFEAMIRKTIDKAIEDDIDIRDVVAYMSGCVDTIGSEFVLRRAMEMRRRERQQ